MQCRSKTKMICELPSRRSKVPGPLQAPPLSSDYCSDRQELTAAWRRIWGVHRAPAELQPLLQHALAASSATVPHLNPARSAALPLPASSSTDAWQAGGTQNNPTTPRIIFLALPRAVPLGQPVTQHHLRVGFSHLQPHGSGRGRACNIHGCRIIMGCQWRIGRLIGLLGWVDGSLFCALCSCLKHAGLGSQHTATSRQAIHRAVDPDVLGFLLRGFLLASSPSSGQRRWIAAEPGSRAHGFAQPFRDSVRCVAD